MSETRVHILNHTGIMAGLRRMAYQIYEANYLEEELVVIGVDERGGLLADEIVSHLRQISPLRITLIKSYLDRSLSPVTGLRLSEADSVLTGKAVLVVDDVLYSGKTLLHVVAGLLPAMPRTLQTAVLIDRGHRLFPIGADFVGLQLATTIQQHVSVEIEPSGGQIQAFLS
ncbi:MAG: phosphoribosyltransferase [Bacteroidetes bacterium]|nr:MAG: phosphoribosyltransferase [Bacteroidota bacterium]